MIHNIQAIITSQSRCRIKGAICVAGLATNVVAKCCEDCSYVSISTSGARGDSARAWGDSPVFKELTHRAAVVSQASLLLLIKNITEFRAASLTMLTIDVAENSQVGDAFPCACCRWCRRGGQATLCKLYICLYETNTLIRAPEYSTETNFLLPTPAVLTCHSV
jgi:hypothetical protein